MPSFTVNDRPLQFRMDPATPLAIGLREGANLTGTKLGCGAGDCSACMVLIDGDPMRSCQITLAEAEGRNITTIEGLSTDRSHPVQQAFVAEQAIQCGFCTPGMVLAAAALLARNVSPSDAEIIAAIPNLCRCGVYPRVIPAVRLAGRVMRGETVLPAAPAPGVRQQDAARLVPAIKP